MEELYNNGTKPVQITEYNRRDTKMLRGYGVESCVRKCNLGVLVSDNAVLSKKCAFTLAEVLITLAIIGIVAMLTIPSVISNYKEKQFNTARLKALKTFGEAGRMASINEEITGQANATNFVNNVLSKYLKIMHVCNTAQECNFPSGIQPLNPESAKLNSDGLTTWRGLGNSNTTFRGGSSAFSPTKTGLTIYVTTADGFSAKVFYNPLCGRNTKEVSSKASNVCTDIDCWAHHFDLACMNVIYDMNGTKSPNQIGYDMGIVTTYFSGPKAVSVAPGILPYNKAYAYFDEAQGKKLKDAQTFCASKGDKKIPYNLPNIEEISTIKLNDNLTSLPKSVSYWSGSPVPSLPGRFWYLNDGDSRTRGAASVSRRVWCVRR